VIRCVGAIIHDQLGRLLLVQRAREPARGQWSLPGGRVEPGETDHSAVYREVLEETGLRVEVGPQVGRVLRPAPQGTYDIGDYSCRTTQTAVTAGDDAAEVIWADAATFATLQRDGALTEGLAECLRSWACLPHDE
jgi:8-oxo-dGTP diphosphatase